MAAIHDAIAATRVLLTATAQDLWAASWDAGDSVGAAQMARVATLASHAEVALFDVLNAANAYLGDEDSKAAMALPAAVKP